MKIRRTIVVASILTALIASATGFAEQQTYNVVETAADTGNQEQSQVQQARQTPQTTQETQTYTVRSGDTLSGIAQSFNIRVNDLVAANNIRNRNRLSLGQVLKIPGATGSATVETQTATTAKTEPASDAGYDIAQSPLSTPSLSTPSTDNQEQPQIQQAQQTTQTAQETRTYTVRRGDTLSGIAQSFNLRVNDLIVANNIVNSNRLSLGQVLTIPGATGAAPETQTAATAKTEPAPETGYDVAQPPLSTPSQLTESAQNSESGATQPPLSTSSPQTEPASTETQTVSAPTEQATVETAAADTDNQEQPQIQQAQQTPQTPQTTQTTQETRTYTVRRGDTLSGIAQSFNIRVNDLVAANNIVNRNRLSLGQVLTIPGATGAAAKTQVAASAKPEPEPAPEVGYGVALSSPLQPTEPAATGAAQAANRTNPKPAANAEELTTRDRLVEAGFNMLGIRYRFGGTSEKTGLDCSALVRNLFAKFGFSLPRTSREQYTQGERVAKEDLQKGDLVFFSSSGRTPTHVGVYIGGNQFLHAASRSKQVVISDLGASWYDLRYLGARRIVELWHDDIQVHSNDIPPEDASVSVAQ